MKITEITREQKTTNDESVIEQFLDQCTSCGVCRKGCSFLESYGSPDAVIARNDRNVALCTNCGACNAVCPSGLAPSEALHSLKSHLLRTGQTYEKAMQALLSARKFVDWGSSFPFVRYPRTGTVFWPGCSLAGMAPHLVPALGKLLTEQLGEEIGIALDCCGDPVYELGDLETTRQRTQAIEKKLTENGITTIIAGCGNCVKILRTFLPQVKVEHVLEVLPETTIPAANGERVYLHHPCPSFRYESIQRAARRHCSGPGSVILEQAGPQCCGQGGGLPAISKQRADACIDQILDAAGEDLIVTYCMGCKEQFLRKGRRVHHLFELLVSARPQNKLPSSPRKWFNRVRLSFGLK